MCIRDRVIAILVSTQEGVGESHGRGAAAERRGTKLQVRSRQKIGGRGIPVNEVKVVDSASTKRERVANGEAEVNRPAIVGAVIGAVGICVGHSRSNSQHQAAYCEQ